MRPLRYVPLSFRSKASLPVRCISSSAISLPGGRSALYRRIGNQLRATDITKPLQPHQQVIDLLPSLRVFDHTLIRTFSTTIRAHAFSYRDLKSERTTKEAPPPTEESTSGDASSAESAAEKAYREAQKANDVNKAHSKRTEEDEQSSRNNEKGNTDGGTGERKKKEEPPLPPPHGNKSPLQVFMDTLRSEFKASKEWNESTKQLASSANAFTENESVRRARAAYSAASDAATSTTTSAIKGAGRALGQGAARTWDSTVVKGVRSGVNATASGIEKATKPVRETKVYQAAVGNVKNVIDDGSSSRYGGWIEKEERRKQRELRELNEFGAGGKPGKAPEKIEEDPNAGTNVTLHKDSAFREQWRNFKDSSKVMQSIFSLKSSYNESENPLVSTARTITDKIAGFFAENETAMVIKKFREMDPTFQVEPFLRDMREYILPEVLDAYVKGDVETLKLWLSAAQYQVYAALTQQYTTAGLKSDGRILDIRHVDILSARMLENEIPVFIITCRTQEVHVYRNAKTNELAAGQLDRVQLVTYAIGITRIAEDVHTDTRGWRLIELQKSARDYI